LFVCCECVS